MLTHRLCCALRALGKRSGNRTPTQLYRQGERCKTLSFRANDRQLSLQFNFVGKGSDAKEGTGPPQTGFARQLPLYDLRFASVDKGSDARQRIYRDINEYSVYIG